MESSCERTSILFVCIGNICRSPMAEGYFRKVVAEAGLTERFLIDSAATGSWHIGRPPDGRAQQALSSRGIDISTQRARQVTRDDFDRFDLLLAMDRSNYVRLRNLSPSTHEHKIELFLKFAPEMGVSEVPDPYFGGMEGFAYALQLIEVASRGLLTSLVKTQSMTVQPYVRLA